MRLPISSAINWNQMWKELKIFKHFWFFCWNFNNVFGNFVLITFTTIFLKVFFIAFASGFLEYFSYYFFRCCKSLFLIWYVLLLLLLLVWYPLWNEGSYSNAINIFTWKLKAKSSCHHFVWEIALLAVGNKSTIGV